LLFSALQSRVSDIGENVIISISRFCRRTRSDLFYWALGGLISLSVIVSEFTGFGFGIGAVDGGIYDSVLDYRFSSPKASENIVILDIDEKSLAMLAPTYGRWPWKREVLAQAIAELEASSASGIIVNVLFSDPDIEHEESDATLDYVATESRVTTFPMVRLAPENDGISQLRIRDIPGITTSKENEGTLAAVMPFLGGMMKSIGISNLQSDDDGILRQFALSYAENDWRMPTLVGRVLQLANIDEKNSEDPYYLNWRNKNGRYKRVSFSDYFSSINGEGELDPQFFAGKFVVMGASAPGISNLVPTPTNKSMDDNEILATAIDDAIHGTNLRLLPDLLIIALALMFVFFFAYLFARDKAPEDNDFLFLVLQGSSLALVFFAVSYTNYFIDLSPMMAAGAAYFTVARLYASLDKRVTYGAEEQFKHIAKRHPQSVFIAVFEHEDERKQKLSSSITKFEKLFGIGFVFYFDEVFLADRLTGSLNDIGCLIVLSEDPKQEFVSVVRETIGSVQLEEFYAHGAYNILDEISSDPLKIRRFISQKTLLVLSQMKQ
jgi:CHASE2 domain-containing sensor protein